ncbi:MAG: ABC transporter ATP-binding protein [Nitrospirae bacterium]|nr:ABC transporter ATP-binding protein [Candidatus Manganitrophaceae bacterium]
MIQVETLWKVYKAGEVELPALRGVSFSVARGEFVALMGPSGSGKSTLMHLLGCLDRPTRGRYLLDGVDIGGLKPNDLARIRNQKIGFVFQGFNLLSRTTALENVELPMIYTGDSAAPHARAQAALERVGLGDRLYHYPNQLSGGQQQRVAIARALVMHSPLILADEPTGNLDTRTSVEIMALFQELNEGGMTLILVTHEPDIAQYASRIIRFRDGEIQSDLPVEGRAIAKEALKLIVAEAGSV